MSSAWSPPVTARGTGSPAAPGASSTSATRLLTDLQRQAHPGCRSSPWPPRPTAGATGSPTRTAPSSASATPRTCLPVPATSPVVGLAITPGRDRCLDGRTRRHRHQPRHRRRPGLPRGRTGDRPGHRHRRNGGTGPEQPRLRPRRDQRQGASGGWGRQLRLRLRLASRRAHRRSRRHCGPPGLLARRCRRQRLPVRRRQGLRWCGRQGAGGPGRGRGSDPGRQRVLARHRLRHGDGLRRRQELRLALAHDRGPRRGDSGHRRRQVATGSPSAPGASSLSATRRSCPDSTPEACPSSR